MGQRAIIVVHITADAQVDIDAELRIAYSIDGTPPRAITFGPTNFANHQQFFEARAIMAIIPIRPGFHTVQPFWGVSGASGKQAVMVTRCITIEGNTM